MEIHEIEFLSMPYGELRLHDRVPVLGYCFEEQPDSTMDRCFPELAIARERVDKMNEKSEAELVLFPGWREDEQIMLGMIYVKFPWRKRRNWSAADSNFYRRVSAQTIIMVERLRQQCFKEIVVLLPGRFYPDNIVSGSDKERLLAFVQTVVEAFIYGNNTLDDFKSDAPPPLKRVTFVYFGNSDRKVQGFFQKAISRGTKMGRALAYTRRLIELPTNTKYPAELVRYAIGIKKLVPNNASKKVTWKPISARSHNFSSRTKISVIYGTKALKKFGFGMVAAVGQGSVHEPLVLRLHYKPKTTRNRPVKKVVLTGKGVTFDSGGIDLKLTGAYDRMHRDMAGAATVLGVMRLAEATDLPVELYALIPIVHNAVSGHAIDPHSVITAYDGKSVEIINTDAEGRLVVGDVVAYAEAHLRSDCTISVATLCDGSDIAPDILKVLVTTPELEQKVRRAEKQAYEKIMLWPSLEYLNHLDDDYVGTYTDLVNSIESGYHSAGLLFIAQFLKYDPAAWIYLDVSSVFDEDVSSYDAGPGFGLRLLWYILLQFK